MQEGIECAERAVPRLSGAQQVEGALILCEGLYLAGRTDDLAVRLEKTPQLTDDPRGRLHLARVRRRQGDLAEAERLYRAVFASNAALLVRRNAGFELARLLDSACRYQDAFAAARETHAATGVRFDTGGLVREVERSASFASRGGFRMRATPSRQVEQTALICSLPRSGTTLIEQMLDRHPNISGVGEIPAVEALVAELSKYGGWPDAVTMVDRETLDRLQATYLAFVAGLARSGASITTLDKTIHTWRRIPAIAAALPGAKLIRLRRDPRDNAISIFLSNFHRESMGWQGSMEEIRSVIAAERRFVPMIAKHLGVELLDLSFEEFVTAPREHLAKALEFLGLPWCEQCQQPEGNSRVVITLSHEQVRRPVNSEGIGRWRNYAEHFDDRWSEVLALSST
ncbi:MAG: sulfotransferase [Phycisphaerae bacterium]|nr:sulfotransferase [Phycisphaerae bacterium]